MYKAARESAAVAERETKRVREQLDELKEESAMLRREMIQLKREREEIRGTSGKDVASNRRCGARTRKSRKLEWVSKGADRWLPRPNLPLPIRMQPACASRFSTRQYNLRGSDPEYIIQLAEYVDSKMRAVAEQTHTVETARLAVLAALNIADEYHLLKRKQDGGSADYQKRAHHLANALDEVLSDRRAG